MRYIEFGTNRVKASEIVLGLMRLNGTTPAEADALFDAALECGINFIDTAAIYVDSEELVGKAFARNPGLRDKVIVQTKLGIRRTAGVKGTVFPKGFTYFDFSYDHIIESVEKSLRLMGIDVIDSLLLHRPDILMEPEEIARAFEELHDAGKVIDFGVSNLNPAMMSRLEQYLPFPLVANQVQLSPVFAPAFENMVNVNMEVDESCMRDGGIFEYGYAHDQAIQAWSPFQKGYFEGCYLGDPDYKELNETLERIAGEHGVSPAAVAVAWILRYPAKMQTVLGSTKPERIRDAAQACDFELTRTEWYEIYLSAGRKLP